MSLKISSLQNPRIKFALSLQKASVRKKEGLFVIEGLREINLAIQSGYRFQSLYFCPDIIERNIVVSSDDSLDPSGLISSVSREVLAIETTATVFRKLVYRENSDGLFVIAFQKKHKLNSISLSSNPLLLVVESVEKPGNLGAILRTADAAGVDALLACNGITDIYNPNVVRSSLGTLFTMQIAACTTDEAVRWLKEKRISIFTTSLNASLSYHLVNYTLPAAIVAGSEATGISPVWEENSEANIIIPMFGKVDSMNVSVATSIVLYEALRQRNFHN